MWLRARECVCVCEGECVSEGVCEGECVSVCEGE